MKELREFQHNLRQTAKEKAKLERVAIWLRRDKSDAIRFAIDLLETERLAGESAPITVGKKRLPVAG